MGRGDGMVKRRENERLKRLENLFKRSIVLGRKGRKGGDYRKWRIYQGRRVKRRRKFQELELNLRMERSEDRPQ